jgi:Spy/CpxP family protein refolding chaperone
MEKTKLLTITVIGLLLLNFATLGFLFISGTKGHKPPHDIPEGRHEPKEIIIERLHFDANQQKEYGQLIEWHRGEIRQLEDSIRVSKNELYMLLNNDIVDEKAKVTLINEIALFQKQIEATHFKHFEDIKKLCKPEQQVYFNELTEEFGRLFYRNKPPRPRHE